MIFLIDNYDSFTYNLYQYVGEINKNIMVKRNDETSIEEIEKISPSHIIISPGPGHPSNSGICFNVVRNFVGKIPILGICLGHQIIAQVFGGQVNFAKEVVHGKQSDIIHNGGILFTGVTSPFKAVRYHSLAIIEETLPEYLVVDAWTENNIIMAISHVKYPVYGLQFHPESILTNQGKKILKNFLDISYYGDNQKINPCE